MVDTHEEKIVDRCWLRIRQLSVTELGKGLQGLDNEKQDIAGAWGGWVYNSQRRSGEAQEEKIIEICHRRMRLSV